MAANAPKPPPEKPAAAAGKSVGQQVAKLGDRVKKLQEQLDKQPVPEMLNRPELQNRAMAAMIDFFVVIVFFFVVSIVGGMIFGGKTAELIQGGAALVAALYALFKDGVGGRSLGKRMVGLKVIRTTGTAPVDFVTSAARNWPLAALFVAPMISGFLSFVPGSGWIAMAAMACGFALALYEVWRVLSDKENGLRTGDTLAGTKVTEE